MPRPRAWHLPSAVVAATCITWLLLLPAAAQSRKVEQIETPAGIKAWLVEERSIPLVAIRFTFAGGAVQDPAGKEGLAGMLSALLTEGAGDLNSDAFARRSADQGAQISVSSGRDQINGGLDALSKRLAASAELLRLALTVPRFDVEAVDRVREQRLADLEMAESEPRGLALKRWYAESFPGHPYGRPVDGTAATVKSFTRDDFAGQHKRLLARDTLRVVVVGDLDRVAAIRTLDRIFGGLPARATLAPVAPALPARIAKPAVVEKELPLATAAFGVPSLAKSHTDYPVLQVLAHIIGSGDFDATLMEEIRVKRGLAYAVSAGLIGDSVTAILLGGMATKNESMAEALRVLREVLGKTAAEGPTSEQLQNAKLFLTGSFLLDFDTNSKLAGSLLRIWLDGKTPTFMETRNAGIQRVTMDDLKRVARNVLAADRLNVAIVGKPALP